MGDNFKEGVHHCMKHGNLTLVPIFSFFYHANQHTLSLYEDFVDLFNILYRKSLLNANSDWSIGGVQSWVVSEPAWGARADSRPGRCVSLKKTLDT